MLLPEKYKTGAYFAYALVIVLLIIQFITVWNKISMHPGIIAGNSLYLIIILIGILVSGLFIFLLYSSGQNLPPGDNRKAQEHREASEPVKKPEHRPVPYEVNVDMLAESVIPKTSTKESLAEYTERLLINVCREFDIVQGVLFLKNKETGLYEAASLYAWSSEHKPEPFAGGEGLTGQVVKSKKTMLVDNIPEQYINVASGLGSGKPRHLVIIPLLLNKEVIGIIELASFSFLDEQTNWTLKNLSRMIGNALVTKIKSQDQSS